jgi:hypothetical protein
VQFFYLAVHFQNVTMACKQRNISRDFFYRWWQRLWQNDFKIISPKEQSRKLHLLRAKISAVLENRILESHRQYNEGGEMMGYRLRREGFSVGKINIQLVLRRRGREN